VSAPIKDVSGDAADSELNAEKCQLAVVEDASHQTVSLGCDVHANPEKRELGVKPVQTKQETAFGKLIHVNSSLANVVKLHPIYARTPEAVTCGGPGRHGRNETRSMLSKKIESRVSSNRIVIE